MKSALVLLSLVALSQAGVPMPRALDGRIINGEDVMMGEIPYQVSLQNRNSRHFCGGSILNKNYVITAAHCVVGKQPIDIKVIAGTIHLDDPKATHEVTEVIVHKNYDSRNSWINDIALLKVASDFQVSRTISYIPLPEESQHVPVDSPAIVSGWGDLKLGGPSPRHLQRAEIYISDQNDCSKVYSPLGFTIHDTHICANEPEVITGACHGDSGGPLTVDGKLIGIVSWSFGCAQLKYPAVYTRVPEYIDWIAANAV